MSSQQRSLGKVENTFVLMKYSILKYKK